jgi:circadian clock protein KaiB
VSATVLLLFVAGPTARSEQAIADARKFCEHRIGVRAELDVVDVVEQPEKAEEHRIVATPTLVEISSTPGLRIVGDLPAPDEIAALLSMPDVAHRVHPHVQAVENLDLLTANEQYALVERVFKGRQAKDVGADMHVSGSRVAQLVAAAQKKIRAGWGPAAHAKGPDE